MKKELEAVAIQLLNKARRDPRGGFGRGTAAMLSTKPAELCLKWLSVTGIKMSPHAASLATLTRMFFGFFL